MSDVSTEDVERQRLYTLNAMQNSANPWSPDGKCLYCGVREVPPKIALCGECEARLERLQAKYPDASIKRVQEKIAGGMTRLGDTKPNLPAYRPPHNSE